MTQRVANRRGLLATRRELGPHRCNPIVEIDPTFVHEPKQRQRDERLPDGVEVDDRVALPHTRARAVGPAAHQIDHGLTVADHGHTRTDIAAVGKVRGERLAHGRERSVAVSGDGRFHRGGACHSDRDRKQTLSNFATRTPFQGASLRTLVAVRQRFGPRSALLLAGTPSVLLILLDPQSGPVVVTLAIALSMGGLLALRELEHRGRPVGMRSVWLVGMAVIAAAVVVEPRNSGDLWSYVMYGRILAAHHASPWATAPAAFGHDPFLHLVSRGWRHTTSIYGPAFVGVAAMVTKVAGSSVVASRVLMKSLFALATLSAGLLVARRTRSAAATAIVLLHPVVVVTGIAGGHNDILVGLAILGAVLLAIDDRPVAAGLVAAVGAAVKLTGGIAIVAIAVWSISQRSRSWSARFSATAIGALLLMYAPVGTAGLSAFRQNHNLLSRASPWQLPRVLSGLDQTHAVIHLGLPQSLNSTLVSIGTLVAGALVLVLVLVARRTPSPVFGTLAGIGAFLLFASYVLPWYSLWMIPLVGLVPRTPIGRVLILQSATIVLVYELKFQGLDGIMSGTVWWSAILLSVFWCVLFIRAVRRTARETTALVDA